MSHTRIVLDKDGSQFPAAVVIDQDQQVQIGQGMNITGLKGTVYPDQRYCTGALFSSVSILMPPFA